MRIEVRVSIIQTYHEPYGEHPPHVVDKPAAIVFVLERVSQSVNDVTLLRRVLRQLPDFLHADRINLRTLAGVEPEPVYQLLGGKVRDRVRIKLVVWARDVEGSRKMAEEHLARGVTCVKVKTGLDVEGDIARVRAVREVTPKHIPVTIDSNCGWTIQQAK